MTEFYLAGLLPRRAAGLGTLRRALGGVDAAVLGMLWRALEARDPDVASELGARLGRAIGPRLRRHGQVVDNLRTAFPFWRPDRIDATAREVWGSAGRTIAEYPLLPRISDPAEGRVRVVDLGGLDRVRSAGRPGVFVSGHFANWELLPMVSLRAGIPLTVVYTRQKDPRLETRIAGCRMATGCGFVESGNAGRQMLREMERGRSLGILMDQRFDRGEEVPLLGIPAATSLGPAKLALRFGVPLIPLRIQRLGGARFVITVHPPIPPEPGLPEHEQAWHMTARVNGLFGCWIAETPGQWLCVKRRWPRA